MADITEPSEPDNDDWTQPPSQSTVVNVTLTNPMAAMEDRARSRFASGDGLAPKAEANYREAFGLDRCGNCEHYCADSLTGRNEGTCDLVAGVIRASMLCDWYQKTVPALERQPEDV